MPAISMIRTPAKGPMVPPVFVAFALRKMSPALERWAPVQGRIMTFASIVVADGNIRPIHFSRDNHLV
jgi:hypothetical protein